MDITITIILGSISIFAAIVAAYYAREALWASKSPKVVLEAPFNSSLEMRNIGTDIAKNIKETTDLLKNIPKELWSHSGQFDYLRIKNPGLSKTVSFQEGKIPPASTKPFYRFEYENSEGDKFYSEILVDRGPDTQQIYIRSAELLKWGKM